MKDQLGDRMKSFYEDRTRYKLTRRTNTIIRVDGKSFSNYTKGLQKPFDAGLIEDMDGTALYLCKNIQGAKFAYVQSDEISILITDYDSIETDSWFDSNLQKMASIGASLATSEFNKLRMYRKFREKQISLSKQTEISYNELDIINTKFAQFDARVFQIPYMEEVINYFIWRQQDATRNSIQSVAQSLYSHKELNGKNTGDLQEMIFQKGINWNDYSAREKRGSIIKKSMLNEKSNWKADPDTPIFTREREYLGCLFPSSTLDLFGTKKI